MSMGKGGRTVYWRSSSRGAIAVSGRDRREVTIRIPISRAARGGVRPMVDKAQLIHDVSWMLPTACAWLSDEIATMWPS